MSMNSTAPTSPCPHGLFERALQAHAVGQPGQRIVGRQVLDLQRGLVLLGDVAGGAADAEDLAALVMRHARVDADPAVAAVGRRAGG